jgi:ribulose-phosphate 3-epimerase
MNLYKNNQTVDYMKKTIQVSASILCADFTRLNDEIKKCEEAAVDSIHVDVMDGHFVPNITIGHVIISAIRPLTKLPIEAHLMIENPGRYINDFITAGADIISVHAECYGTRRDHCRAADQYPKEVDAISIEKAQKDINLIKGKGKKAFMVINPGTPICFAALLDDLDGVLIMSVNPGFAKQKFMPSVLSKIEVLRESFDGDISIDGGINESTAPQAVKAGANILATASYFFGSKDPKSTVLYLKSLK